MYIPSNRPNLLNKRYIGAAVFAVILFLFITSDSGPDLDTLRSQITDFALPGQKGSWKTRKQFVNTALANDIYTTHYDGAAVRKLCGEAKWRDDRVVECNRLAGGIGNMKINLLGCVRFAIEAGGKEKAPESSLHLRAVFTDQTDRSNPHNTGAPRQGGL